MIFLMAFHPICLEWFILDNEETSLLSLVGVSGTVAGHIQWGMLAGWVVTLATVS